MAEQFWSEILSDSDGCECDSSSHLRCPEELSKPYLHVEIRASPYHRDTSDQLILNSAWRGLAVSTTRRHGPKETSHLDQQPRRRYQYPDVATLLQSLVNESSIIFDR